MIGPKLETAGTGAFTDKTVATIWDRDHGRCAWCGEPVAGERGVDWSVHHREPRGSGGSKLAHVSGAANGVLLHGSGTTGCHGRVERERAEAERRGFLVSRHGRERPSNVPIMHAVHGRCLLDDNGDKHTGKVVF
jgi:hypothetical protein